MLTPNLSLDKHFTSLSAKCFFQLQQLHIIRRLIDDDSVGTVVHVFVASHIDCCVGLLAGAPKKMTDKLQCFLSPAVWVVLNRGNCD